MSRQLEELKRDYDARLRQMGSHVERVLQQFQQDLVTVQGRTNLAWNAMNAVLKSFLDKGLITEDDIVLAGKELHAEAVANMKKTREAAQAGAMPVGLQRTPLELIKSGLEEATKRTNEKDEEKDGPVGDTGRDVEDSANPEGEARD